MLAIRDTPNAIAGGIAIGLFFSITPLFGLKTLLTIFVAWLTRSNLVAAFLASASYNIALPLMPLLYRGEYDLGYWLLSHPHHWPPALLKAPWQEHKWLNWARFLRCWQIYIARLICMRNAAGHWRFFVARKIVTRHHRERAERAQSVSSE